MIPAIHVSQYSQQIKQEIWCQFRNDPSRKITHASWHVYLVYCMLKLLSHWQLAPIALVKD